MTGTDRPPTIGTRGVAALVVGVAAAVAVGVPVGPTLGVLVGIGTAAAVFVATGWAVLWPLDADATRATVQREEFRPRIAEVVVVAIAVSGLVAIVARLPARLRLVPRAPDLVYATLALVLIRVLLRLLGPALRVEARGEIDAVDLHHVALRDSQGSP